MMQIIFQPRRPISEAFAAFDAENPAVYELFKRFADELRARGQTGIGAKMIVERIRWEMAVETTGADFKVSNNFTAHYARKLVAERPEFADLFEMRRLRA